MPPTLHSQRAHVLRAAADAREAHGVHRRTQGAGIQAVFHYVPLHDAPMGVQFGRAYGELGHTLDASNRLVRLPLWLGIEPHLADVIRHVIGVAESL